MFLPNLEIENLMKLHLKSWDQSWTETHKYVNMFLYFPFFYMTLHDIKYKLSAGEK